MPHPQEQEIREKLRVFLDDTPDDRHREYRMLLVYEPESGARFEYYYEDEDSGLSPHIRFNWMEADKREREIAARLGVRAPRKSKKEAVNPFTGEPLGPRTRIPEAKREVLGVDDA